MLRVDPAQRHRLTEIIRNLNDRIAEARMNNWPGEAEGLQVSLQAAKAKLHSLTQAQNTQHTTHLGIPVIRTGRHSG